MISLIKLVFFGFVGIYLFKMLFRGNQSSAIKSKKKNKKINTNDMNIKDAEFSDIKNEDKA